MDYLTAHKSCSCRVLDWMWLEGWPVQENSLENGKLIAGELEQVEEGVPEGGRNNCNKLQQPASCKSLAVGVLVHTKVGLGLVLSDPCHAQIAGPCSMQG